MSDDERIERLTELARRVWKPRHHGIEIATTGNFASVSTDGGAQPLMEVHFHARALDALEAALLVLAGASCRLVPPAWVEQLADEWQDDGDGLRAFSLDPAHAEDASFARGGAAARIMCAQELRKRATKETR